MVDGYGLLMAHFAVRGLMHEAALQSGRIRTGYPFSTPYALSATGWPPSALFPPQDRENFHKAVLEEILDERVASSQPAQPTRRQAENEQLLPAPPSGSLSDEPWD